MDYYKNIDQMDVEGSKPKLQGLQYELINDIPPNSEPVSLDFFKAHARIDFDTDDTLAAVYLKAAREYLEKWTQKSFGNKTWRVRALRMPENFRLANGPVDLINTPGFTHFGDILIEGGENIEVVYVTTGIVNDAIRIAICRYATGLYVQRENYLDTKIQAQDEFDQAKALLQPFKFITLF